MRKRVVAASVFLAAAIGPGVAAAQTTQVAFWSPLDESGAVKATLNVKSLGLFDCGTGAGSVVIVGIGYRCGTADPCWLRGPAPTNRVVCADSPWVTSVFTFRVPYLMLRAGVTFGGPIDPARSSPWGIELVSGDQCVLFRGSRGAMELPDGRRIVIDYHCHPSKTVLLRNLRRGDVWRIGSARWTGRRYRFTGDVAVQRAIFGSLPPPMQQQSTLARQAVAATGIAPPRVLRVRLSFPDLAWAYAEAYTGSRSVVVHRVDERWRRVHVGRVPCRSSRVPPPARRQLFGCGLPARVRARLNESCTCPVPGTAGVSRLTEKIRGDPRR